MTKPGPKPDPARAQLRSMFPEWSDRTFSSYYTAFIRLAMLVDEGAITDAHRRQLMQLCVRPNGSVNTSKFARIASDQIALWHASLSDGTQAFKWPDTEEK